MSKQFAYQDAHGHIYPAHGALAFQPGLVPGWYDTQTRSFTPNGNPQEQVGTIITDAGVGASPEKVMSGLRADRGAGTAPITSGVVFTSSGESGERVDTDPDAAAKLIEAEEQLAAERERAAALEARLALLEGQSPVTEVEPTAGQGERVEASESAEAVAGIAATATDDEAGAAQQEGTTGAKIVRRGRKAAAQ